MFAKTVLLSACASKPIIDTYNVNMVQYQKDLDQCEDVAEQVESGKITAKSDNEKARVTKNCLRYRGYRV